MAPRQARVADRLITLREELGISQEEAVARTNGAVTLRQWQRWEGGQSEPYKRNLATLSEVFRIPISDFFEPQPGGEASQLDRVEAQLGRILDLLAEREIESGPQPKRKRESDNEEGDAASTG